MENIKNIKVTDIDLKTRKSIAIVVEIDIFKFTKETELGYILIEIESNGEYEYLDEMHLEEKHISLEDLERIALNWIFKHIEIVKEEGLKC